jgi:hypothetical protein
MGANDPIQGVGVGLGKKPNPAASMLAAGTSTVFYAGRQLNAFLAAKNQSRPITELNVHHAVWFDPQGEAQSALARAVANVSESLTVYTNVQVIGARRLPTGLVEVTFHHGGIRQLTGVTATARAVATKGISGN